MKPTMLLANCRCAASLDLRCCGRHDHFVLSWTSAAVYIGVVLWIRLFNVGFAINLISSL